MPRTATRPDRRRRLGFEPLEERTLLSGGIADVFPANPVNETDAGAHIVLLQGVPGSTSFSSGVVAETLSHELRGPTTGGCLTYEYQTEATAELSIVGTVGGRLSLSLAFAAAHIDGLTFDQPVAGVPTRGRVEHMQAHVSFVLFGIGSLDAHAVGDVSLYERETCTQEVADDESMQQVTQQVTVVNEMRSSVNLLVRAQGSYSLTIVMYVSRETVLADHLSSPSVQSITHESTGVLFAGLRSTSALVVSGTGTVEWDELFSSPSGDTFEGGRAHARVAASGSSGAVAIELYGTANKYVGSVGSGAFGIVFVDQHVATARVWGNGTRFSALGRMETHAENFSGVDTKTAMFIVGAANPVAALESQVLFIMDPRGLLPRVLEIRDEVLAEFPWLM